MIAVAFGLIAGAAVPASASAAVKWRCSATPLSGTLLGQQLPTPRAGSLDKECGNDATLPTIALPAPLDQLARIDLVNGVTAVNDAGAYAGAGLAQVKIGALPIPIGDIPIPDELKSVKVYFPDREDPVASVDLSPAIDAIQNLPSRALLDAGVLYSNVTGTCQNGQPVINGSSRILNADVLGLTLDSSHTVDTAVNLIDTEHLALDSLNTKLAHITILDNSVDVTTEKVLNALDPVLDELPALSIPPTLAHVKATAGEQERVNGVLTQRALRLQISLLGRSIADLRVGEASVGDGNACEPPRAPRLALECTKRKLVLIDVLPEGDHVRLFGAADQSLTGKTVRIVFKATKQTVAKVRVKEDGSFTTTAPMPPAGVRYTNRARYQAFAGGERSMNLKLNRRMIVHGMKSKGGFVTIKGHVVLPLANPVQTIEVRRRVTCREWTVVKHFKPNADGSFKVRVRKPKNLAATVFRLATFVRNNTQNPKLYPTFTLPRAVDL